MTSIYFKVKDTVDADMHHVLEIFFKDWVDGLCNNEVKYGKPAGGIFKVDFEKQQDALALKLKGIPPEFKDYLCIII